jgi:hypothetical protein
MSITAAISGLPKALKKWYSTNQNLEEVIHGQKHRLALNSLHKEHFEGDTYEHPVLADWGGIATADFATAQELAGTEPLIDTFQTGKTIAESHRVVSLGSQLIGRTLTDRGSFFDKARQRSDLALAALADFVEFMLWQDGYNVVGQVANTSYATTTLTLTKARDAKWFRKGMKVVAVLVGAGRGGAVETGELTVAGKSVVAGTVTTTGNLSAGIPTIATDAYLIPKGAAANTGARKGIYGFKAWASTPSEGEDFLGVDRSIAAGILSMNTWSGSRGDIFKAVTDADAWAYDTVGGVRNWAVFNPQEFNLLAQQLHTQVQFEPGSRVQAGFSFIVINGTSGAITCVASPYVEYGEFYLMYKEGWDLVHLYEAPIRLDDLGGTTISKLPNLSGGEIRAFSMVQLGTKFPGWNIYGTLS